MAILWEPVPISKNFTVYLGMRGGKIRQCYRLNVCVPPKFPGCNCTLCHVMA